ncbi:hypothetical protein P4S93_09625 [Aneurinibacillus thermoaerophilus]|uniref:hypothetical protein n=1 Tax=Aneurinibacillus thermoaerophilus TaxID=143495 RepID=UPI002E1AB601|nr:hypothetical protein [Aneurinibacillus thermoaerophilus]MED0761037.1 hypothetical protein [Aneurinibacillus thermoaerophilus]
MVNAAKPKDSDYVSPNDGGCWFCCRKGDDEYGAMLFDSEFDTYLHESCLRRELKDNPQNGEAQVMKYLIE